MSGRTRRALLASVGVGAAAVAGCLGGGGGGSDEPTATPTAEPTGVRLHHIDLINRRSDPQTVHLQVERDGEVVYWNVHELGTADGEGASSVQIDRQWPDGPARFTIEARVGDGPVQTATYATGDCIGVFAPLDEGGLGFYTGEVDCGTATTTASE